MSQQPSPPALPPAPRRRDAIETHLMPDGSALLYDPTTNKAHALDPIGSFIWEFCDGNDPDRGFIPFAGGEGKGDWNGTTQQWTGTGWKAADGSEIAETGSGRFEIPIAG